MRNPNRVILLIKANAEAAINKRPTQLGMLALQTIQEMLQILHCTQAIAWQKVL
jgi:hypothetical protein